jgi:cyclopropane-fatty-acyl-phospholipid synthase
MQATISAERDTPPEAIQHHYDAGDDFYRLWLDPGLTYSCALWQDGEPDGELAAAQQRKLDYHVDQARARGAGRVLDVGCGWGSLLRHLVEEAGVAQAVGLTLSRKQADWIASWAHPRLEVRLESWLAHAPEQAYDAIVSVGAFEHFARTGADDAEKVATYRRFFAHCHAWLKPGGRLSLQTIAYGNMDRSTALESSGGRFIAREIFPEAGLPTLEQIVRASDGLFELLTLRNDREHYARTCRVWFDRLTARRAEAVALAGKETFTRYSRYLRLSAALFHYGYTGLLRLAFRRLDEPRGARPE